MPSAYVARLQNLYILFNILYDPRIQSEFVDGCCWVEMDSGHPVNLQSIHPFSVPVSTYIHVPMLCQTVVSRSRKIRVFEVPWGTEQLFFGTL